MTMDDSTKAITESIAEACVSSFIESFTHSFPGSNISNLKVRVESVRPTLIGDESSVTDNTNQSRPNQRKLEDGVKPPLVLTKEFSGLQPRQRKDLAAERWNRFAVWPEALRSLWFDACWENEQPAGGG